MVPRPPVALGRDLGPILTKLLGDTEVPVVQVVVEVPAGAPRLAREHGACLEHDDVLAAADELVGHVDAGDAGADDAHVRLQVGGEGGEGGERGEGLLVHPDGVGGARGEHGVLGGGGHGGGCGGGSESGGC